MICLKFALVLTVNLDTFKTKINWLFFNLTAESFIFQTQCHYVVQAGLELLRSGVPFASASWVAGSALRHGLPYQATLLENLIRFVMKNIGI